MGEDKKSVKPNFGLGILLGVASFFLSLGGTAMATFGGNEDVAGICLIASWVSTVAAYKVSGGIRNSIKASFVTYMGIASSAGESAKENVAREMRRKGFTYMYKYEAAHTLGPVLAFFLFFIWIS